MDEFKDGKSLYEERKSQGRTQGWEPRLPEAGEPRPGPRNLRRPKTTPQHACEQWTPKGCKASLEAVELGLRETAFACVGLVPPECTIRLKLEAGQTVKELFNK